MCAELPNWTTARHFHSPMVRMTLLSGRVLLDDSLSSLCALNGELEAAFPGVWQQGLDLN